MLHSRHFSPSNPIPSKPLLLGFPFRDLSSLPANAPQSRSSSSASSLPGLLRPLVPPQPHRRPVFYTVRYLNRLLVLYAGAISYGVRTSFLSSWRVLGVL